MKQLLTSELYSKVVHGQIHHSNGTQKLYTHILVVCTRQWATVFQVECFTQLHSGKQNKTYI